ncbi:MAG: aminotransferase DegT [Omnitrophica WOR_2 bacterium RIFCSPHIGHO2_01_FULL_49_10]|nr:MAG: aminotransferase DegT [Omnitrophica WOR_2 bacterium RIFCSPHIGHO2_01_FULL_49_10]OGX34106.1 MAG: aminotransferase DegT [Omnitrophica WOR_2 bacterium RIFCSPLOWO2_02_FULL_50_19]
MIKKRAGKSMIRVPFGTILISDRSKRLIKEILDSNRVSSGKYVREFERKFAGLVGVKEAVALSSGTDADALALAVLHDFGAKRNDDIIVPALSFVATGNSVLQAGFNPVFVDIDRKTLNIDPLQIERAITWKTRAIMPVHLMGKPAPMDEINKIAKKHKLFVIEDAAEAHGAKYKGRNIGTLGDMAAFSLYVAHIITTIEGGVVVTNKREFAEILRSLRSHGRACKCEKCVLNVSSGYCTKRFKGGRNSDIRFVFERIGYSSKMNELEAAVGLGNIDEYGTILARRRRNLKYLMGKFKRFRPYLVTIGEERYERIGPHAFPIIVQEGAGFTRDKIVDHLEKNGIETRTLFSSMPTQCAGFKYLGYKEGDFPNAEYIGNNGFHIGVHQDLGKEHLDHFLDRIAEFLDGQIR